MTKNEFKAFSTEDAFWACYACKPKVTSNIKRMDKKDLNEKMITPENHQAELSDTIDPLESVNESLLVQINQNETQMLYADALKLNTHDEMGDTFGIIQQATLLVSVRLLNGP